MIFHVYEYNMQRGLMVSTCGSGGPYLLQMMHFVQTCRYAWALTPR